MTIDTDQIVKQAALTPEHDRLGKTAAKVAALSVSSAEELDQYIMSVDSRLASDGLIPNQGDFYKHMSRLFQSVPMDDPDAN